MSRRIDTSKRPLRWLITVADCWILDDSQGWRWQKEAPVAHYGLSEMTGRKEKRARSMATLLCPAALNSLWELASSICNFKASGSALESFRPCVCVCSLCVCVCERLVNYSFASHWRATATHPPFCAWRVRRQENPSSHEITDYMLRSRPRGLDGGRTGEEETKGITANM